MVFSSGCLMKEDNTLYAVEFFLVAINWSCSKKEDFYNAKGRFMTVFTSAGPILIHVNTRHVLCTVLNFLAPELFFKF